MWKPENLQFWSFGKLRFAFRNLPAQIFKDHLKLLNNRHRFWVWLKFMDEIKVASDSGVKSVFFYIALRFGCISVAHQR